MNEEVLLRLQKISREKNKERNINTAIKHMVKGKPHTEKRVVKKRKIKKIKIIPEKKEVDIPPPKKSTKEVDWNKIKEAAKRR